MRFWVDIANSPHVTLFRPVVEELQRLGHDVQVTVWDRGQTASLASHVWPDALVIGSGFRRSVTDKAAAVWTRARTLAEHLQGVALDVALSHNSYSQIVAGRLLGLPVVTAMDYEHQPANHLAFRLADRIILPGAIPFDSVRRFGATRARIVRYPGLKEEVALSTFRPDPAFRRSLGLDEERPLVTLRPPAEGALYHRRRNPRFEALALRLNVLQAQVVLSPRTHSQAEWYRGLPGVAVLERAVSGPDLLFHSDLVIGAGGTMTREAVVLGTPCFTLFSGPPAAVDLELIREKRLHVLTDHEALLRTGVTRRLERTWEPRTQPLQDFTDAVVAAASSVQRRNPRRPRVVVPSRRVGPGVGAAVGS
jgi:predicted glycosyltransferase